MKIFDALGRLQRLYDWERCMWRMKGISRRYLLTRTSSQWGWVRPFSDSVKAEVLLSRPDSEDLAIARLTSAFDRGFERRSSWPNLTYFTKASFIRGNLLFVKSKSTTSLARTKYWGGKKDHIVGITCFLECILNVQQRFLSIRSTHKCRNVRLSHAHIGNPHDLGCTSRTYAYDVIALFSPNCFTRS